MKFLVGLGIGIGLGLLFAPARGEETRDLLSEKLDELAEAPQRKAAEMADTARRKAGDMGARLRRRPAESLVQTVTGSVTGQEKPA